MSEFGYLKPTISDENYEVLRKVAWQLRKESKQMNGSVDVLRLLEHNLYRSANCDYLYLNDNALMKSDALVSLPHKFAIISESIYMDAVDGKAYAREIITHEIGHLVVHSCNNNIISMAAATGIFARDSVNAMEVQASFFVGCLLAPIELIAARMKLTQNPRYYSINTISRLYGVTRETAQRQINNAKEELNVFGYSYIRDRYLAWLTEIEIDKEKGRTLCPASSEKLR